MSKLATETLIEKVKELAGEQVQIAAKEVLLDSQFLADLGYDSLDMVEFVMTIEDEFDISVPDEVNDTITTVGGAIEAIQKLML